MIELDDPYLKIDLETMLNALPKGLTKKTILQPKSQSAIQEQIKHETIALLAPCIANLRQAMSDIVSTMDYNAETKFKTLEKEAHHQIQELLAFEMDDALIKQLQETNEKLKALL